MSFAKCLLLQTIQIMLSESIKESLKVRIMNTYYFFAPRCPSKRHIRKSDITTVNKMDEMFQPSQHRLLPPVCDYPSGRGTPENAEGTFSQASTRSSLNVDALPHRSHDCCMITTGTTKMAIATPAFGKWPAQEIGRNAVWKVRNFSWSRWYCCYNLYLKTQTCKSMI
jgi:hypothetical protein